MAGRPQWVPIQVFDDSHKTYIRFPAAMLDREAPALFVVSTGGGMAVSVYRGGFGGHLSNYEKTPTGKAIRAVIMEISDYLGCAMVDKDDCLASYQAKEKARRDKSKSTLKIE